MLTHRNKIKLFIYPIKGLRGCSVQEAEIAKFGFKYDRCFCLQKIVELEGPNQGTRLKTMHIGEYLQLALFNTELHSNGLKNQRPLLTVCWEGHHDQVSDVTTVDMHSKTITIPLLPEVERLHEMSVEMNGTSTLAYDMGPTYASWFSERLGFKVKLVYIGQNSRRALGSFAPNSSASLKQASFIRRLLSCIPWLARPEERLVFNDLAQYLVVSEESNAQVSSRLSGNMQMDITKFRPNVVVTGQTTPFAEDFWGELIFSERVKFMLTANCIRCQSITVDYRTGKAASDDSGQVWKRLNKDRRIDPGSKWSPVFGRYGFVECHFVGAKIRVGQHGRVSRYNKERTSFDWPT